MIAGSIPMQPRHFRRIRRAIWTLRCFMEYRRRLNGNLFRGFSNDPWKWSSIWQIVQGTVQSEADSNDLDGWAWSTPAEAVDCELECWTE